MIINEDGNREYVGCVIHTGVRDQFDWYSYFALVWDEDEQRVKFVEYAHGYGVTGPGAGGRADVDITPENWVKAQAYLYPVVQQHLLRVRGKELQRLGVKKDAQIMQDTKVKGQVIPAGICGRIIWVGKSNWGGGSRVGLLTTECGKVFLPADRVEVIGWEAALPAPEELDGVVQSIIATPQRMITYWKNGGSIGLAQPVAV